MKESQPIKTSWSQRQRVRDGEFDSLGLTIFELDTPVGEPAPLYFNRSKYSMMWTNKALTILTQGMKRHADLHPPLNAIDKLLIPTRTGEDGKRYYQVEYETHATYFSARCEYTLWFRGKNYGSVEVEYT